MADIEQGKPRPPHDVYRVMVMDGDNGRMEQIKSACKELGQEVVPVMSIRDGMAFMDTKDHVDLVVSEAFLENESVFDFLKMLKKESRHKDVPVMLMATEPGDIGKTFWPSVAQTAAVLGAYKFIYMEKFDIERLMREIQATLPLDREPKKESDPEGAY